MVGFDRSRYSYRERRGLRVEIKTEIDRGILHLVGAIREVLYSPDHGSSAVTSSSIRNVVTAINV